MQTVKISKELPEEFFGNILLTAFDGSYGYSWNWFRPLRRSDGSYWLHGNRDTWMSVQVALMEDYHTGNDIFDSEEGFLVDHSALAGAIERILLDDYVGLWRQASPREQSAFKEDGAVYGRRSKLDAGVLMVETGETARACVPTLLSAVTAADAGDIDAEIADAIVQVACFGKVVFG